MASLNPTNFFNIYRYSSSNSVEKVFSEVEKCLEAYYQLQDDCEGHPDWQRKIEEEVGGTMSFLAKQMDEASRDEACKTSEVFKRFDFEKQKYFK